MSGFATAAALAVTISAICWLAATDAKRRRAFRLPPFLGRRRAKLAVAVALLPGGLLLVAGNGAGFVLWLAVASVAGWAVASVSPRRTRRAWKWLSSKTTALRSALADALTGADGGRSAVRVAALEARVASLEAAVAEIRSRGGALTGQDDQIASIAEFRTVKAHRGAEA